MEFGGDGDGGRGGGGGDRDVDSVAWENGGGCPIIMEVDCVASRGGGKDCLEREREWALWLKRVEGTFLWWSEWVTNSATRRVEVSGT